MKEIFLTEQYLKQMEAIMIEIFEQSVQLDFFTRLDAAVHQSIDFNSNKSRFSKHGSPH